MERDSDEDVTFNNSALHDHLTNCGIDAESVTRPLNVDSPYVPEPPIQPGYMDRVRGTVSKFAAYFSPVSLWDIWPKGISKNELALHYLYGIQKSLQSSPCLEPEDVDFLDAYMGPLHRFKDKFQNIAIMTLSTKCWLVAFMLMLAYQLFIAFVSKNHAILITLAYWQVIKVRPECATYSILLLNNPFTMGICGCIVLLLTRYLIQYSLMREFRNIQWRFERLVELVDEYQKVMGKAVNLIQESEIIARGFTLTTKGMPFDRIECNSLFSSHRQCADLRHELFLMARATMLPLKYATQELIKRPASREILGQRMRYLANVPLEQYGPCVTLGHQPHSMHDLFTFTDSFSISSIKAMCQLCQLQQTEFIKVLVLSSICDPTEKNGAVKCLRKMTKSVETPLAILEEKVTNLNMVYTMNKANILSEKEPKVRSPPTQSELSQFYTAIHSLHLHLWQTVKKVQEIADDVEMAKDFVDTAQIAKRRDLWTRQVEDARCFMTSCRSCFDECDRHLGHLQSGQPCTTTIVHTTTTTTKITPPRSPIPPSEPTAADFGDPQLEYGGMSEGSHNAAAALALRNDLPEHDVFEGFVDEKDVDMDQSEHMSSSDRKELRRQKDDAVSVLRELKSVISGIQRENERREDDIVSRKYGRSFNSDDAALTMSQLDKEPRQTSTLRDLDISAMSSFDKEVRRMSASHDASKMSSIPPYSFDMSRVDSGSRDSRRSSLKNNDTSRMSHMDSFSGCRSSTPRNVEAMNMNTLPSFNFDTTTSQVSQHSSTHSLDRDGVETMKSTTVTTTKSQPKRDPSYLTQSSVVSTSPPRYKKHDCLTHEEKLGPLKVNRKKSRSRSQSRSPSRSRSPASMTRGESTRTGLRSTVREDVPNSFVKSFVRDDRLKSRSRSNSSSPPGKRSKSPSGSTMRSGQSQSPQRGEMEYSPYLSPQLPPIIRRRLSDRKVRYMQQNNSNIEERGVVNETGNNKNDPGFEMMNKKDVSPRLDVNNENAIHIAGHVADLKTIRQWSLKKVDPKLNIGDKNVAAAENKLDVCEADISYVSKTEVETCRGVDNNSEFRKDKGSRKHKGHSKNKADTNNASVENSNGNTEVFDGTLNPFAPLGNFTPSYNNEVTNANITEKEKCKEIVTTPKKENPYLSVLKADPNSLLYEDLDRSKNKRKEMSSVSLPIAQLRNRVSDKKTKNKSPEKAAAHDLYGVKNVVPKQKSGNTNENKSNCRNPDDVAEILALQSQQNFDNFTFQPINLSHHDSAEFLPSSAATDRLDNSACNDLSTNDVSANDFSTNDVSANDLSTNDASANNLFTNDVSANNLFTNNVSVNDLSTNNLSVNQVPNFTSISVSNNSNIPTQKNVFTHNNSTPAKLSSICSDFVDNLNTKSTLSSLFHDKNPEKHFARMNRKSSPKWSPDHSHGRSRRENYSPAHQEKLSPQKPEQSHPSTSSPDRHEMTHESSSPNKSSPNRSPDRSRHGASHEKTSPDWLNRDRPHPYSRKSPDRKSPDQKSPDQKSPHRKSPDRQSPDRKSPHRNSPDQKSHERKSPDHQRLQEIPQRQISEASPECLNSQSIIDGQAEMETTSKRSPKDRSEIGRERSSLHNSKLQTPTQMPSPHRSLKSSPERPQHLTQEKNQNPELLNVHKQSREHQRTGRSSKNSPERSPETSSRYKSMDYSPENSPEMSRQLGQQSESRENHLVNHRSSEYSPRRSRQHRESPENRHENQRTSENRHSPESRHRSENRQSPENSYRKSRRHRESPENGHSPKNSHNPENRLAEHGGSPQSRRSPKTRKIDRWNDPDLTSFTHYTDPVTDIDTSDAESWQRERRQLRNNCYPESVNDLNNVNHPENVNHSNSVSQADAESSERERRQLMNNRTSYPESNPDNVNDLGIENHPGNVNHSNSVNQTTGFNHSIGFMGSLASEAAALSSAFSNLRNCEEEFVCSGSEDEETIE